MNDFSGAISESITHLGEAFLVAFYIPASVFMLAHFYILIPAWTGTPLKPAGEGSTTLALPFIGGVDLASLIGTLLLPLLIGMILLGLNDILIRAFEGKLPWLRKGLLARRTQRNRERSEERYRNLVGLREEYERVSHLLSQAETPEEQLEHRQTLAGLSMQITEEHEAIKQKYPPLPQDLNRVAPTVLGNIYAVAEEYPYQRYKIDSVLFWPRLRALMYDKDSAHSERLTQQKTALDLSINFAFIAGLLALEAALTIPAAGYSHLLLFLVVTSVVLAVGFHQATIGAVGMMGELIRISYDFYRGLILESFNLETPADLAAEREVWVKLALFIQGGDDFYFPVEALPKPEAESEKASSKQTNKET